MEKEGESMSRPTPEQRRAAAQRGAETARRNAEKRRRMEADRKAERQKQAAALRRVRDDPNSSSAEVLRAVELLDKLRGI